MGRNREWPFRSMGRSWEVFGTSTVHSNKEKTVYLLLLQQRWSFWTFLNFYTEPSLGGDIHVLNERILTLQLAYHGAITVDFMSYAGKWGKQVFNIQCVCAARVTVPGLCVVCLTFYILLSTTGYKAP